MERIKGFLNQKKIVVLLLVLLVMSIVANLYFVIRSLQESEGEDENGVWAKNGNVIITRNIQGGMGSMSVSISGGLLVDPGQKFNVSVSVKLWEPYMGSATYNFYFKIYNRTLDGEYPETPMVEKTVVVHKDKDTFYIYASSGNLTITVPSSYTPEIYIYKVEFGNLYYHIHYYCIDYIEFAITAAT